jgi:hypothetical protein
MSSIDIKTAKSQYKGGTEAEMLHNMAKAYGCRLIYKYANDFGNKITHTDYKVIMAPGDDYEKAFLKSPYVNNVVLVYREGNIVSEKV